MATEPPPTSHALIFFVKASLRRTSLWNVWYKLTLNNGREGVKRRQQVKSKLSQGTRQRTSKPPMKYPRQNYSVGLVLTLPNLYLTYFNNIKLWFQSIINLVGNVILQKVPSQWIKLLLFCKRHRFCTQDVVLMKTKFNLVSRVTLKSPKLSGW